MYDFKKDGDVEEAVCGIVQPNRHNFRNLDDDKQDVYLKIMALLGREECEDCGMWCLKHWTNLCDECR